MKNFRGARVQIVGRNFKFGIDESAPGVRMLVARFEGEVQSTPILPGGRVRIVDDRGDLMEVVQAPESSDLGALYFLQSREFWFALVEVGIAEFELLERASGGASGWARRMLGVGDVGVIQSALGGEELRVSVEAVEGACGRWSEGGISLPEPPWLKGRAVGRNPSVTLRREPDLQPCKRAVSGVK